ncbi:MAG: ABC transporter permease [Bacteroidetes bacterium]|nr:ABC transporter permease [Bacteroidota bacterium]MBS1611114.1 ABC transporter permease [Bacteroidota bacterium]
MIKKYFTTTIRHLWRYRLFTALNIFGLAISISACWVIFRIINYDFSYEKGLKNKDQIYRLISGFIFDDKESYNGGVPAPVYQGVREQVGSVDKAAFISGQWINYLEVNSTGSKPVTVEDPTDIVATDSVYFNLVPYKWIAGNKSTALTAPESLVLTESRAKKYFPGKKPEDILNNTITYYTRRDTVQRTITGIVADHEMPSEFTAKEFFALSRKPFELNNWTNTNGTNKLYLQFKPGANTASALKQIENMTNRKWQELEKSDSHEFKMKHWFQLLPLPESHFSTFVEEYTGLKVTRKASKPVLYGLAGVALFLLLLACINYINMSIARMPQRAKEIGVRKTLGSSQSQLLGQFLSETIITALLASILSYSLSLFGFWLLRDIIPEGVTPFGNFLQLLLFIISLIIVVTLLAGIYPGWLITRVKTINVFRNTHVNKQGSRKINLQKVLIVFQFFIALIFITCALITGRQLQYTLKSDMGFTKEAVIIFDIPWKYQLNEKYKGRQFTLLNELRKISGVKSISMGTAPMTDNYSSGLYEYSREGKEPVSRQVYFKWVDTGYLNLYGMKLIAGRNLLPSDTTNEFVINETAARAFGFKSPQDALGKMIGQQNWKFPIVGVIKDFHLQNFYKAIDPVALQSDKENLSNFNIKLESKNPSQWQETLKSIEKKWYEFYPPESFSYKFYDEAVAAMYEQERHFAVLVNLATAIAIFISCLGLFGLAVLTAFQRTKEIGIRKVLGASVTGIVQLLSKEYIRLVVISIVLATPVAWWAMNKWLQDFAYRIQIRWWMFALAGMAAIVIALITVSFQAIKAARANPVKSLRTE